MLKTPLHTAHVKLGARMAPFGGWDMPIQYEGILAEHEYTRKACGLFDICHMGEFELRGRTATADLERLLTLPVSSLAAGQCKYGYLLNEEGGVLDDLTCYRLGDDHYMLVVNAATCASDAAWIKGRLSPGTEFHDISPWTGKLDIQGPKSRQFLEDAIEQPVPELKYFFSTRINLLGQSCLLSRTGYTGEWGYELYMPMESVPSFWDLLLSKGAIKPMGLGARDTLRLEAGYPLYGHELSIERTPAAAFGKSFMNLEKEFCGKVAVQRDLEHGTRQKLVGLKLNSKRAARHGDIIWCGGQKAGIVTSGSLAPSLGYAVALGYIDIPLLIENKGFEIEAKGARLPASIEALPFYKHGTARAKSMP